MIEQSDQEIILELIERIAYVERVTGMPSTLRPILGVIERLTEQREMWRMRSHHTLDLWLEYNPEVMPEEVTALLKEKQDHEDEVRRLIEDQETAISLFALIPSEPLELMLANASDPDRDAVEEWIQNMGEWAKSVLGQEIPDGQTAFSIA